MRQSGILMHITSLPAPYGVGTMGSGAYGFVDFLKQAGQRCWQVLPLTPTGYGDSPYQSCSAYAGNPYLIDLELLEQAGLLTHEELTAQDWGSDRERVDFGKVYTGRRALLRKAYSRFSGGREFDRFCRENSSWLSDFALYMALKDAHGGQPWYQWETPLKMREPDAIWNARRSRKEEIRFYCFQQYLFSVQWTALKDYAHANGVHIIGDVPIYVPLDCAEVWSDPALFLLDAQLTPIAVAGCPPDYFSRDGQLWGNPLYRWDVHAADGYSWWLRRMAAAAERYDVVRIDHFRGFESYWAVPYGQETARGGKWVKGPGMDFLSALKQALPELSMIAEDLGTLTPQVLKLREDSGYPGMKVLGFAFDSREPSAYLPHNHIPNSVCYTGTHDNMTARQWLETADPAAVEYATEYMQLTRQEGPVWGIIRTAMASVAQLCMVPMQDYLELGGQARMNFPGTASGNWVWRMKKEDMTDRLAEKIARMTALYGRTGGQEQIGE